MTTTSGVWWMRVVSGCVVLLGVGSAAAGAQASGILGNWRNPTGSVVAVYGCGSDVCLKLIKLEKGAPGTVDENNPNAALRTRALCGLEIGRGFRPGDGGQSADGGSLYDPKSGKTYSGSLQVSGANTLKLRGYVGMKMFGRTEEWQRVSGDVGACLEK